QIDERRVGQARHSGPYRVRVSADHRRRSGPPAAGRGESDTQCSRGDGRGAGVAAAAYDPHGAVRLWTGGSDRCGLRPRDSTRGRGVPFRFVLYDEVHRHGAGTVDRALDRRSPWWNDTGGDAPRRRGLLPHHPARAVCDVRRSAGHERERECSVTMLPIIHVVDDDDSVRVALTRLLRAKGYETRAYKSAGEFLMET